MRTLLAIAFMAAAALAAGKLPREAPDHKPDQEAAARKVLAALPPLPLPLVMARAPELPAPAVAQQPNQPNQPSPLDHSEPVDDPEPKGQPEQTDPPAQAKLPKSPGLDKQAMGAEREPEKATETTTSAASEALARARAEQNTKADELVEQVAEEKVTAIVNRCFRKTVAADPALYGFFTANMSLVPDPVGGMGRFEDMQMHLVKMQSPRLLRCAQLALTWVRLPRPSEKLELGFFVSLDGSELGPQDDDADEEE